MNLLNIQGVEKSNTIANLTILLMLYRLKLSEFKSVKNIF